MTGNSLNGFLFLVGLIFDFYVVLLIMRLLLTYMQADLKHSITQFIFKLTDPIVKPLKRAIPNVKNVETAAIVAILVIELLRFFFIIISSFGLPNFLGLFALAFADALRLVLQTLTLAVVLQALIGWINPTSPAYHVLSKLTSPIMRPFQRIVPPIAGVDITPILVVILLQLLIIIVVNPIKGWGWALAVGA